MSWGIALPDGTAVRGRGLRAPPPPGPAPEFGLYLARPRGWEPAWPSAWIDWPDFRTPRDGPAAAAAITDAYERARAGLRVEVACGGGIGRTGTVIACMAVLAGHPPGDAVGWARRHHHRRAVETPGQRRWVGWFAAVGGRWTTRPETGADIAAIRAVVGAAFPTTAEADLVDALRADPAWIPGLSIVAADADEVAGHALLTRCHVDDAPALCLGPCAVRPDRQRSGAGSAAVRAALAAARDLGEHHVIVLGHPTYYPRFGFTRASEHGIRVTFATSDGALMALSLNDRALPRGTVRFARPFGSA